MRKEFKQMLDSGKSISEAFKEICELRELRNKEKHCDHIEQCFIINQKIDMLRDKKREINDELRHDYNEKVGSTFAISDETVKVKRRK